MDLINICVCTFKRSQGLETCLLSLKAIKIPNDVTIAVTVIDNDSEGSAGSVVEQLKDEFPHTLHYHIEKRRGIPFARNRAIQETSKLDGRYLVFIDDDEWVEPNWLSHLYDYSQEVGGGVIVSGHVISELPEGTPGSVRALFNRKSRATGDNLSSCATNNVLVPMGIIQKHNLFFDETRPFAGGTDTIFFCQAVSVGASIRYCAEAVVHEDIPANRLRLGWLAKRKYRAGITNAWRKQYVGRSRTNLVISSVFQIVKDMLKTLVMLLTGQLVKAKLGWLNVCRSAGTLAGVVGHKVDSYHTIDGA